MILYNNSYKTMILKLLQRNNINRYSKYNPYWCGVYNCYRIL